MKSKAIRDPLKIPMKELLSQRRIWAALLSGASVVAVVLGYPQVSAICTAVAGALGLDSYIRPKKD